MIILPRIQVVEFPFGLFIRLLAIHDITHPQNA